MERRLLGRHGFGPLLGFLPPLAALRFALLAHTCEAVFHVYDAPDLSHEPLGFQLILRPARGEVLEFRNPLQDLSPLAQAGLAACIEPRQHRAGDFMLPH